MKSPPTQDVAIHAPAAGVPGDQAEACHGTSLPTPTGGAAPGRGGSPVRVTRGESVSGDPENSRELAQIDWLAFTVRPGRNDWRWVRSCLHYVFEIPANAWHGTNKQWNGYRHRVDLINPSSGGESLPLGLVAWGGESQRETVHVSLNGQACARIVEWPAIRAWGESTCSVITRVDAAHDDFEGETVNIDQARAWLTAGGFSMNGRPPGAELYDDLGSGKGKTLYVGNRAFGKLCRVYEKGKKEGDPASPWCRVEVEWRNQNREIPWDILVRPGDYLAGAYPCLKYLSVHQERIKTIRQAAAIQYPRMVEWVRSAAGKALYVIHQVEGGDAQAVLKQVLREGSPKRLEPFTSWPGMLEEVAHADNEPQ